MKRILAPMITLASLTLLVVASIAGGAGPGPQVGGSFFDGPYAAATPDSGSCGNNWAVDLFNRQFEILPQNPDGSWTVKQTFLKGRFITLGNGQSGSGASPGQCDGPGNAGHVLKEGVIGTFKGSFTITVQPGFSYVGNGGCGTLSDWPVGAGQGSTPGDCTTGGWIAAHFPGAVYGSTATVTSYNIKYNAKPAGQVTGSTWTNANTGNSGDIYN
jgi:hypothetical protein